MRRVRRAANYHRVERLRVPQRPELRAGNIRRRQDSLAGVPARALAIVVEGRGVNRAELSVEFSDSTMTNLVRQHAEKHQCQS